MSVRALPDPLDRIHSASRLSPISLGVLTCSVTEDGASPWGRSPGPKKGCFTVSAIGDWHLASPGGLDGGDVDLLHRHHRLEGTLGLIAAGGERIGVRKGGRVEASRAQT